MLMKDDKKKAVTLIVSRSLGNDPKEKMMEEHDYEGDKKMIAEEIMSAMESKDSEKLASSLSAFIQICEDSKDYQKEMPEESEKE
jgi:hypothetical protein